VTNYEAPKFVNEGQEVYAPYGDGRGIRCRVVTAAGKHARVVNEQRGFDRWLPIDELRIPRASRCPECGCVVAPSEGQDGWHRACLDGAAARNSTYDDDEAR